MSAYVASKSHANWLGVPVRSGDHILRGFSDLDIRAKLADSPHLKDIPHFQVQQLQCHLHSGPL
jgi:hypothetical protein